MQIRNLILIFSKRFRWLQDRSESFWKNADNSYFGSPELYALREKALREQLLQIGRVRKAIDVGCGDGRYTLILKNYAEQVDGYDLSEKLVSTARTRLTEQDLNVQFHVAEINQIGGESENDIVTCLGVTTCIIDNTKFACALDSLVMATCVNGYLILIDTLSETKEIIRAYRSGYIGKYRQKADYERELLERGMTLLGCHRLADMGEGMSNYLYVFKRHSITLDP